MKRYGLIGAAGYVAPRHMKAIKDTNGELVAAMDKFDSVGIIDSYFPHAAFFTEFERFDRFLEKIRLEGKPLDYLVVCSPNHLHDAHIRFGLRIGAHVICEKPLVLNPWNLDAIAQLERSSEVSVNSILQMRLHPVVSQLKNYLSTTKPSGKTEIELTYIAPRGNWYYSSWKGDNAKSGGVITNIGIHLFDLLGFLFGEYTHNELHVNSHDRAAGYLEFEQASIKWFLSINEETLPKTEGNQPKSLRQLKLDSKLFDFSSGFEDLHKESYKQLLEGNGFGIEDARYSIQLTHDIRNANCQMNAARCHPLATLPLVKHPFNS